MNISFYNRTSVFLLLVIALIKIPYFDTFEIYNAISDILALLSLTILLLLTVISGKISRVSIWILSFFGVMFLATLLADGDLFSFFKENGRSFGLCLAFLIWLEECPEVLFGASYLFELLVYANLLTVLLFPNGLYQSELYSQNWLLGYKNPQVRTILPIICLSLVRSYRRLGSVSVGNACLVLAASLTFVLNGSATSLVGMAVFLVLLLLFRGSRRVPGWFSLATSAAIAVAAFLLLDLLRSQEWFSWFITSVLGRRLDFTGRDFIWRMAEGYVRDHPLLGYGYLTASQYVALFGGVPYFTHPHNFFLHILMMGGAVLGAVLGWGIWQASASLSRAISRGSLSAKAVLFCLVAFLVMGVGEALTQAPLLYPLLILGMMADRLDGRCASRGADEHDDDMIQRAVYDTAPHMSLTRRAGRGTEF